ncbi:MAG TPA: TonB-dependent receptor [Candidatus Elarobacter sp.]
MTRRFARAALVGLQIVALVASSFAPSLAAADASDVIVEVVDAGTGKPIGLARVLVVGENGSIGYTDADGRARFESVATGTYRASISKRGYNSARSPLFDVVANRATTVRVKLAKPGGLQQIGSVSVSTSPARASREVGQDDALRHLDGSLRDAIGDLPGVTASGDGFAIDGNDPSQTGTSIDGVAIAGAGAAFGNRGINADLFAGASASSGASNGSLGGSINFRTLQPTRLPQQQATVQYASDNGSSALLAARGSIRNLGYVVQHAARGRTNGLTGQDFTDVSGLRYVHDGDRFAAGDLLKLRWAPSLTQTLTLTASRTDQQNGIVCSQQTALYPCGFGPGLYAHQHFGFVTLGENATIGATSVFASGYVVLSRSDDDRNRATFGGVPAPSGSQTRSLSRGASLGLQFPGGDRHEVSLTANVYGIAFDGTATNGFGTFPITGRTSYHAVNVFDRYRVNQRLSLTASGGFNGSDGGTNATGRLSVRWQPTRDLLYDLAIGGGDAGGSFVVTNAAFPDPRSLTFNCIDGLAVGGLQATNGAHQRSSSLRGSVERSGKHARVALTAWMQHLQGAPVLTAVDAAAIGVPAGYLGAVAAVAGSSFVCGATAVPNAAFTSFAPADQINRGATVSGTLQMGTALFAGYATVQSRYVTGGSAATAALTPFGAQVPDTPLHRAGLVGTVKLGRAVDALMNLSYTAANNPNRLPAYTVLNAGLAMPLRAGSLAIVGTNLTNRFPGPFVSPLDSRALPRAGATALRLPSAPLGPRALALTYTVRIGRLGAVGSGAGTSDVSAGQQETTIQIRVNDFPAAMASNALTIDPDNDSCTPIAARTAQPVLDAIGKIRDAAERAKASTGRYPAKLAGIPSQVNRVALEYAAYDDGARYAVSTGAPIPLAAAFINCARLSSGSPEQIAQRHLYVPTPQPKGLYIAFSPAVGMYFVPPASALRGMSQQEVSTDDEPKTPPADPFALRPKCSAAFKPLAVAMIDAVQTARAAVRDGKPIPSFDVAEIAASGIPPNTWLEIKPRELLAFTAMLECTHVAGIPRARLAAVGIAQQRRGFSLGFADRFGFYIGVGPASPQASPAP